WTVDQFKEKRLPTQAELVAAAPNNPVYVQRGYGWVVMNPLGLKTMNISKDSDLPAGAKFEKDGSITGGQNATGALFDKLPKPSPDDQIEGTLKFFRELNRLGITGFGDPGGNNLFPTDYPAVFKVWRDGRMTVRIAFSLNGQTPGSEFDEY